MWQYASPLLAMLIWAGNIVVSKMAAGSISAAEISFYRWLVAGLLFTPFMLRPVLRNWPAIRPHTGKIVVLGLLGMVVCQSLAYYAAHLTTATHMGIINALIPIMVLALAVPLLGQRLTAGALVGALLSIGGVLIVVSGGEWQSLVASGTGAGDALMLLSVLAYAAYAILLKKWNLRAIPALQLLYAQIVVAIIALLPLYLLSPRVGLSATNLPLVLYAGVGASMAATLLWMHSIAHIGPSRASLFFNLLPLLTALIAAATLGEALAPYHAVGGALTIAGVLLAERWRTPLRRRLAGI
jgi:drug/metabolite transporter (DMT)-like permease